MKHSNVFFAFLSFFGEKDLWHESKRTALNNWLYRFGRGRGNKLTRIKELSDADTNTLDIFTEEVVL